MKYTLKKSSYVFRTMLFCSFITIPSLALAQNNDSSQRRGPPPEAFIACEGKSSGDSCTAETPHGTKSGTCEDPRGNGKLICAIERPMPNTEQQKAE